MNQLPKTREEITCYCGLECSSCEFVESCHCNGCIATKGRPFHVSAEQESCAVAKCAMEKGVIFCGDCKEFPCELLKEFSYDPEHGDQGARIERCRILKETMDKEGK